MGFVDANDGWWSCGTAWGSDDVSSSECIPKPFRYIDACKAGVAMSRIAQPTRLVGKFQ
jgi:hypothetical protein